MKIFKYVISLILLSGLSIIVLRKSDSKFWRVIKISLIIIISLITTPDDKIKDNFKVSSETERIQIEKQLVRQSLNNFTEEEFDALMPENGYVILTNQPESSSASELPVAPDGPDGPDGPNEGYQATAFGTSGTPKRGFRKPQSGGKKPVFQSASPSSGSSPNPGNGNSGQVSFDNSDQCLDNPNSNIEESIPHGLQVQSNVPKSKTKQELEQERIKQEWIDQLEESYRIQDEWNERRPNEKDHVTVIYKNGQIWFVPNSQLREKAYHIGTLGSPMPSWLENHELLEHYSSLKDPDAKLERQAYFRDKENLPEHYIVQAGADLRFEVLNPNNKIIEGTWGANNPDVETIPGFHHYNEETGFNAFFRKDGKRFLSMMILNENQKIDLLKNGNVL